MIAIIAAIKEEVSEYLSFGGFGLASKTDADGRFYSSEEIPEVLVVESGIGKHSAQKAVKKALDEFAPDTVVSVGFAAAARPGLTTGDLFICDSVWAIERPLDSASVGESRSIAPNVATIADKLDSSPHGRTFDYASGGCLTVPIVIRTASDKRRVGERFPVSVIDMESFWVCKAASDQGASVVVVRSVFDPMDMTLPPFVESVAADAGSNRYSAAVRYAVSHPTRIPELMRLWALSRRARSSLTKILTALTSPRTPVPVG